MSREGRDVGEIYKIILDTGSDRPVSLGRKAYTQKIYSPSEAEDTLTDGRARQKEQEENWQQLELTRRVEVGRGHQGLERNFKNPHI